LGLPVLFVCENNQYAMSMPSDTAIAGGSIANRAAAYGMPSEAVDGMDLDAVYDVGKRYMAGRRSSGPALIEAVTYRYLGHSKSDANRYRTREEIAEWREHDPIAMYAEQLADRGGLDDDGRASMADSAEKQVEEAFERADRDAEPAVETALEDVYA